MENTTREDLKIVFKAIKSRFAVLELTISKELTTPTKEGLESVITLTELDLKVIKELINKQ